MLVANDLIKGNKKQYSFSDLKIDIFNIENTYDFVKVNVIGSSVEERSLYSLKLGKGRRQILICSGTHGSEWITTPMLIKWLWEICKFNDLDKRLFNISIRDLLTKVTIHFIPMINPDGIELQTYGLFKNNKYYKDLLKWNDNSLDFSKWKSNIRGVDLNRNFDAKWEKAKTLEKENNIFGPSSSGYGGKFPESEPETKALTSYTSSMKIDRVFAYHTQGEEIYWQFEGVEVKGSLELGKALSKASGYVLTRPDKLASYAGYKDWFIEEFKKPGYTIECGVGENPLPVSQLSNIYKKNFKLLLLACLDKKEVDFAKVKTIY